MNNPTFSHCRAITLHLESIPKKAFPHDYFIYHILLYRDLHYLYCEMMSYCQSLIIIWKILLKKPCSKITSNKIFPHLHSPSEHRQNFHMHFFKSPHDKSAMEETKKWQLTQSAAESASRWRVFVLENKAGRDRVLSHSDQRAPSQTLL